MHLKSSGHNKPLRSNLTLHRSEFIFRPDEDFTAWLWCNAGQKRSYRPPPVGAPPLEQTAAHTGPQIWLRGQLVSPSQREQEEKKKARHTKLKNRYLIPAQAMLGAWGQIKTLDKTPLEEPGSYGGDPL